MARFLGLADETDVLAPLAAPSDLANHPTLSKPFLSKQLTELASQSCSLLRKENQAMCSVKHLFLRFCGDHTWAPSGMMVGPDDAVRLVKSLEGLRETRPSAVWVDAGGSLSATLDLLRAAL